MKILTNNELTEILECEKYQESREQYCSKKEKEGFAIYKPDINELCLDIDTEENYKLFNTRILKIEDELALKITWAEYQSTTPGHRHIVVELPFEIDNYQRIALQAVLGSDLIRELLSIFRIWNNDPFPTLLAMKRWWR